MPTNKRESDKLLNPDGRTVEAKLLKQTKQAIKDDHIAASKELLINNITNNMLISQKIFQRVLEDPSTIIQDGRLTPLLQKDYLAFQRALNQSIVTLNNLKKSDKSDKDTELEGVFLE